MTRAAPVVKLADYQAPPFKVLDLSLTIDLNPEKTRVSAVSRYHKLDRASKDLVLFGHEQTLLAVKLNNKELSTQDYQLSADCLIIPRVPDEFQLEIISENNPKANLAFEGLYLSHSNYYTQCEPEGFRRITYFLDRPDILTEYRVELRAGPDCPVLLSNGNLIEQGQLPDGRHFARWHDPFPKPSYLFAMVAGQLAAVEDHFVTQSGRVITLKIYVEPENIGKTSFAMEAVKRAMKWDEKVYGLEYDLDLFQIVAVSDFNMGAMENKGLNIFNAKYVLASPETATDEDFEKILIVVGHEYFHNWTGNRVTLRDWFQLSLKEGLTVFRDQEFTSDELSRAVKRIQDVKQLRDQQFPEDAGPMAHAVRPVSYIEINNFYTPTVYLKGAELVRMLHTLLGKEVYASLMKEYFRRFDGQAVTIEDFLKLAEEVSAKSLASFAQWYHQAGTPHLQIKREYDAAEQTLILTLRQAYPATSDQAEKKTLTLPFRLAFFDTKGQPAQVQLGNQLAAEHLLILDRQEQSFRLKGASADLVPSYLRGFSAPVILESDLQEQELFHLLRFDDDAFNRYESSQIIATQAIIHRAKQKLNLLPEALVDSFRQLIAKRNLDLRLLSLMLQAPSLDLLLQQNKDLGIDALFAARNWYIQSFAAACFDELSKAYQKTYQQEYKTDKEAIAQRDFNLTCLQILCSNQQREQCQFALQHYLQAKNMSDAWGAILALVSTVSEEREQGLAHFYKTWRKNPLVIDKWFQAQASSTHPDVLQHVKDLLKHPDFDLHNPNRVYSIFRHFIKANPYGFHHSSGTGYQIVAEYVQAIDRNNPQVAAMLANLLGRTQNLDAARCRLVKQELAKIAQNTRLSKDVYEVVAKSLAYEMPKDLPS